MLTILLAVLLCAAWVYYLLSVYAAWRLFRPRPTPLAACPPVSILKPLKGATPDLYAHLASFCRIDYPAFQLLFGVRDPLDPAITVVQHLQHDFPECDIVLVVDPETVGSNQKVNTLHALSQRAKYDIFVISDSDVQVAADYLRRIIPPLSGPRVGVVTCPYRSVARQPLPALLESVLINTSFMPAVLLASQVERTSYAFGASVAVTHSCTKAIGGFAALADYLADDYYLGNFARRAGYRVRILPYVVETYPDVASLRELVSHQMRWARTQRLCRPVGYVGTLVTYGTVWAVLGLMSGWTTLAVLSGLTLAVRCLSAMLLGRYFLGVRLPLATFGLVLITDLMAFGIWVWSLGGNTVRWREHTFRVRRDGTMALMAAEDIVPDVSHSETL